jgi:hypothetical protein
VIVLNLNSFRPVDKYDQIFGHQVTQIRVAAAVTRRRNEDMGRRMLGIRIRRRRTSVGKRQTTKKAVVAPLNHLPTSPKVSNIFCKLLKTKLYIVRFIN